MRKSGLPEKDEGNVTRSSESGQYWDLGVEVDAMETCAFGCQSCRIGTLRMIWTSSGNLTDCFTRGWKESLVS